MGGKIDEIVNSAVTQTGGIEDIMKATIALAARELRRENTALKAKLDEAQGKIEWLEDLVKRDELDKAQALKAQREHYRRIGGPDFRYIVDELEEQQAQDIGEIGALEAQFLSDDNHSTGYSYEQYRDQQKGLFRADDPYLRGTMQIGPNSLPANSGLKSFRVVPYGLPDASQPNVLTTSTRARSSTTMSSYLLPSAQHTSNFPVMTMSTHPRSSTTVNPHAPPFNPDSVNNAGSNKPPIASMALAPAPRVIGLRNPQTGRYDSPVVCPKCRQHFAISGWSVDHVRNCKGVVTNTDRLFGRPSMPSLHSMPNLHTGLSKFEVRSKPNSTNLVNASSPFQSMSQVAHPDSLPRESSIVPQQLPSASHHFPSAYPAEP